MENQLVTKNFFESYEVQQKRYNICLSCDKLVFGVCTECKCVMKLKTKLKNSSCPLGKWNQYYYEDWL